MTLARLDLCAERINKSYENFTLLDIGCRTMDLKPKLNSCTHYYGADLIPGENVFKCDLQQKLPFEDGQFDVITALDVLEHLDNPHIVLPELLRVAKKGVFISLPNMHYIEFRLRFMRGNGISGKYTFHSHPVLDRHRWILSYDEAIDFIYKNVADHQVEHEKIMVPRGRTKLVSEPVERVLARKWPNLFAYGVLFEIKINQTK